MNPSNIAMGFYAFYIRHLARNVDEIDIRFLDSIRKQPRSNLEWVLQYMQKEYGKYQDNKMEAGRIRKAMDYFRYLFLPRSRLQRTG